MNLNCEHCGAGIELNWERMGSDLVSDGDRAAAEHLALMTSELGTGPLVMGSNTRRSLFQAAKAANQGTYVKCKRCGGDVSLKRVFLG